jgi:hypothetical protein
MTTGQDRLIGKVDVLPGGEEPSASTAVLREPLPFEEGDPLPLRGNDVQQLYTLVVSRSFRFGVLWGKSGCGLN